MNTPVSEANYISQTCLFLHVREFYLCKPLRERCASGAGVHMSKRVLYVCMCMYNRAPALVPRMSVHLSVSTVTRENGKVFHLLFLYRQGFL